MDTQITVYTVVLVSVVLAGLTGIAAYMRSINGQVPNAIASGIEAGLSQLKHGPLPLMSSQLALPSTARTVVAQSLVEGGGPLASTVKPWYPAAYIPTWHQESGFLPDGNLDPESDNDCGEACVAMIVAGVHGVPMDPGGVRQWLHGTEGSGLTDATELVRALAHYSTAAHVEQLDGQAAWSAVLGVVRGERNVIMLGRWASVGGAMHWQIAVSCGDDHVNYVNPYGATRSYSLKADWLAQYAGYLVVLDSHIHYDCRNWPQPT